MKTPSDYLAAIGRRGGKSGVGAAKRRSPEFYAEISRKSVEARRRKRQETKGDLEDPPAR